MTKAIPEVNQAHEFLEIVMDFRDPRDAVREAISNAFDAQADEISVEVAMVPYRGEDELVLTFRDNGTGMTAVPSEPPRPSVPSFFDLGNSTSRGQQGLIGQKGHGTKTYFNSREIEVTSWSGKQKVYAVMSDARAHLAGGSLPGYDWEPSTLVDEKHGTTIVVKGYNQNRVKGFSHEELKDFILWFSKFGSLEPSLGIQRGKVPVLHLRGLGKDEPETLTFGHPFATEQFEIKALRKLDPATPTQFFVKKWHERGVVVKGFPQYTLDIVFFIEGDKAKSYNPMLRRRGRSLKEGMYSVEERYGLWAAKDHIPVQNVTDWIARGRRVASTKYHAFVNCQSFKLTANRGDIGNTEERLYHAIQETTNTWIEATVFGDQIYRKYEEELQLETSYRRPEDERKEHDRRRKHATRKKICSRLNSSLLQKKTIELLEPRQEIEVYALFCTVNALNPDLFKFRILDYDTHRGYDALVEMTPSAGFDKEAFRFVEFKKGLEQEINHSFALMAALVCWECKIPAGDVVRDITGASRRLTITKTPSHTRYMLDAEGEDRKIEVFVLQDYLKEKCKIEFQSRQSS